MGILRTNPANSTGTTVKHQPVRIALPLLVAVLLLATFILPLAAQEGGLDIRFFIKSARDPLTVGDPVTLRLEVRHPPDSRVGLPQLGTEWGAFEVLDQMPTETTADEDGRTTTSKEYVVTLFAPGQYQTPPLTVTHRGADDSIELLSPPPLSLEVTSVLTEDLELRNLKPQASLPEPSLLPLLLVGFFLATVLTLVLAALGLWLYRRWQKTAPPPAIPQPVIDPRPPEVIAFAELDRIEALDLPARHKIKEHFSLVADCLRRYVEGRYGIPALERTTFEVRQAFRQGPVPGDAARSFLNLFSDSDLVKFARYRPGPEDAYRLIPQARAIVEATTPEPAPEVAEAEVTAET
ncbi:MAG: BatD family protein [Anaerolineae bacterium]